MATLILAKFKPMNVFKRFKKKIDRTRLVLLRNLKFIPPEVYVKYLYNYYTGKILDLKNPVEINEKIQWYKIYYRPKILNQLVDKYAVRSYVEDKIGSDYLNEVYGVYSKPEEILFDQLPRNYVIKLTNCSGFNLIVKDNKSLDKKKTIRLLNKWLHKSKKYYLRSGEWPYKDVTPRLMVEKFIKDDDRDSLTDYKFYCFNGEPKFFELCIDRADSLKVTTFDLNFKKLPFNKFPPHKTPDDFFTKPATFETMIELARKLSQDFPFVRVDFYSAKNRIIFGELTFFPSGGRKEYTPDEYNKIIGDYFILPKLKSGEKIISTLK